MLYGSVLVRLQLNLHVKDLPIGVLPLLVKLFGIELILPLMQSLKHIRRQVDLSFPLEVESLLPLCLLYLVLQLRGMHAIELPFDHGFHLLRGNGLVEAVLVLSGDLGLLLYKLATPWKNDLLEVAGEHLVSIVFELVISVLIIVLLSNLLLGVVREPSSVLFPLQSLDPSLQ